MDKHDKNSIIKKNEAPCPYDDNFFKSMKGKPLMTIHKSCKLCNCELRKKAEEIYLQSRNISHVHRFLEKNNIEISWSCVRTHIINHFVSEISREKVEDYCTEMADWCKVERKKESRLDALIAIMERRIIQIASMADGRDDAESMKMTETMVKLTSTLLSMQQQADDYRKNTEPVKIIIEKIQQIVQVQLSSTPSQEVRKVLMNVVDVLENDLGGIIENGQD
jgi:hypothetical protein